MYKLVNNLLNDSTPCAMYRKSQILLNICNVGIFNPFDTNSIVALYCHPELSFDRLTTASRLILYFPYNEVQKHKPINTII